MKKIVFTLSIFLMVANVSALHLWTDTMRTGKGGDTSWMYPKYIKSDSGYFKKSIKSLRFIGKVDTASIADSAAKTPDSTYIKSAIKSARGYLDSLLCGRAEITNQIFWPNTNDATNNEPIKLCNIGDTLLFWMAAYNGTKILHKGISTFTIGSEDNNMVLTANGGSGTVTINGSTDLNGIANTDSINASGGITTAATLRGAYLYGDGLTLNYVPHMTALGLANGVIQDDGTTVGIGVAPYVNAKLYVYFDGRNINGAEGIYLQTLGGNTGVGASQSIGLYVDAQDRSTVANNQTLYGALYSAFGRGTATLTNLIAADISFGKYDGAGTLTNGYGLVLRPYVTAEATTANLTAITIEAPGNAPTNGWAFKSNWNVPSYFLGSFAVGKADIATAGYALDVTGKGIFSDNVDITKSVDGVLVLNITNSNAGTANTIQTKLSNGTANSYFAMDGNGTTSIRKNRATLYNDLTGCIIQAAHATGTIDFAAGGDAVNMRFSAAGYLGIGTATPTTILSVNELTGFTSEGGHAVRMYNNTGGTLTRGYIVRIAGTGDSYIELAAAGSDAPCGIVFQDIPTANWGWITVGGYAYVQFVASVTQTGYGSDYYCAMSAGTAGKADQFAISTLTRHNGEVGHAVQAVANNGLVKCLIHWN